MNRRFLSVIALTSILGVGATCQLGKAPTNVQVVQGADSVVAVLNTFAHAVENAADQKVITVPQAKQVLAIIRAAELTLKDVPSGGFAVASKALDQIEATAPADVLAKIKPYLTTARAALEAFRG
jgi:hypothetical protein